MVDGNQEILNELRTIRVDIELIKKHMVDVDSIMTKEDLEALEEYEKEKKAGKLTDYKELKKELKL